MAENSTYKDLFSTAEAAEGYDRMQYAPGSAAANWWQLEKQIIEGVIDDLQRELPRISALDFACGTGRILQVLAPRCAETLGVDVNAEMLARAKVRVPGATLLCADLTQDAAAAAGPYDLITAFRFFLNVEDELREQAMRALASRLRDGRSRLVINTHGHPYSYRFLSNPVRALDRKHRRSPAGNLMSAGELAELVQRAGMEVVSRRGMGFIPDRVARRVPARLGAGAERILAALPIVSMAGANQILICRRKS